MIKGEPRHVTLKIAPFDAGGEKKLFSGLRAWRDRR
jgi:hypothetical protein